MIPFAAFWRINELIKRMLTPLQQSKHRKQAEEKTLVLRMGEEKARETKLYGMAYMIRITYIFLCFVCVVFLRRHPDALAFDLFPL